jgi:peroxiredoxin (alkyl hydroperoxide reductase subunit C)
MTLVNKHAPHFAADAVVGDAFKSVDLNDYRGQWVVLFFYPLDFTFVCPTEILGFEDRKTQFQALNARVLGCSTDSKFSHLAWTKQSRRSGGLGELTTPLIADFTKEIAEDYGVLLPEGMALRGVFIIDPEGVVQWESVNALGVGRNIDEVLRVLEALQFVAQHGEVCPANWRAGKETIIPEPEGSKQWFRKYGNRRLPRG